MSAVAATEEDADAGGVSAAAALGMLGAQHLNAVLNDPNEAAWPLVDSLAGFFGLSSEPSTAVPLLPPGLLPDVSAADFERYLRSLATSWPAFVAAREASRAQRSATAARVSSASSLGACSCALSRSSRVCRAARARRARAQRCAMPLRYMGAGATTPKSAH
jgi:hypothetical protein